MRVLGAILAGGKARRFGSDKALALYEGERLIDRVYDRLQSQSQSVIIVGRHHAGRISIPDEPSGGHGPLAGLNAALIYARDGGFTHVLTSGVDVPNLPETLAETLEGDGPAIVQSQPVVGLWPVEVAVQLGAFLKDGGRALYGFAEESGARLVRFDPPLLNINSPDDLPD